MQLLIENLVKLQAIELDRSRLLQQARALPGEITAAEALLAAAQKRVADNSAALSREESLRTRMDREIAGHRQKAARFRVQLDSVTTTDQAQAMEHEIQFATSEAERLENEEFASLERTEAHETAFAAARAEVESLAASLETVRAGVAARHKEINSQIASLHGSREALRKAIEPEWLARFDRVCSLRGTGLARSENQQCLGCRMSVRPQVWNQLREGELLACDSCSRLLYWDPTLAPPPKAPEPEPIPGQGRAIRKSAAPAPAIVPNPPE